jgi:hypothetical protein
MRVAGKASPAEKNTTFKLISSPFVLSALLSPFASFFALRLDSGSLQSLRELQADQPLSQGK